ncbi:uncharacterized protein V6R79_000310 [Siganus canaliculatus]
MDLVQQLDINTWNEDTENIPPVLFNADNRPAVNKLQRKRKSVEKTGQSSKRIPVSTDADVAEQRPRPGVVRPAEEGFLNGLGLDSDIRGLTEINSLCLESSDMQPRTVSNAVVPLRCNRSAQTSGLYVDAGTQTVENVAQDIAGLCTELLNNLQTFDNKLLTLISTHIQTYKIYENAIEVLSENNTNMANTIHELAEILL